MQTKSQLRNYAKKIRKTLDIKNLSEYFCKRISATEIFKNSNNVMIYYPLKNELDFLSLLDIAPSKNYYLPKVYNKELIVCKFNKNSLLKKSNLKIYEPCTSSINPTFLDLVIVPALMLDKNNNRLG